MNDPIKPGPWAGADGAALGWLPLLCPRGQLHLLSRRKMHEPQLSRVCPPAFMQRCHLGHWCAPSPPRRLGQHSVEAVEGALGNPFEDKSHAQPLGTGTPRQAKCCQQPLLVLPPPSRVLYPICCTCTMKHQQLREL